MSARPADAVLTFTAGTYDHAMCCYLAAREWILRSGLALDGHFHIILNSPGHPKYNGSGIITGPLIDEDGWSVRVDLWYEGLEQVKKLRGLKLPDHASLEIVNSYGSSGA